MAFTRPKAAQIDFDLTNISDPLIRINSAESGDNTNDLGIVFERGNHTNAAIVWDESADTFRLISTTHDASSHTSDINISDHHNITLKRVTQSEQQYTTSNMMKFNQLYLGAANGSYFTSGEYQKVVTIIPSADSQNYQVIGRITAQNAGSIHTIDFNVAMRSETLPALSYSTAFTEQYTQQLIKPQLWHKQTTTAGFIIAFEVLNSTIYGNVTVDIDVVPRADSQKANVTVNTTQNSETTSVDAGYTVVDMTKVYAINGSSFTIAGAYSFPTSDGTNGQTLVTDGSGTLSFTTLNQTISLAGDSGTDNYTTGETLTFAGGTGIDTTVSDNNISVAVDSTVVLNNQNNTITSTTAGGSAAPEFELFRDITGSDANYIGQIKFSADNDANQKTVFAKITGKIGDASDGSEDGIIEIAHQKAGSQNINVRMTSTEFKIMNGTDFDVETHDGSSTGLRLANTLVTATAAELNRLDGIGSAAVGLTDTQTLTNKTLTSAIVTTDIRLNARAELEFYDSDSSHYVSFRAPATITSNITWTLPASDGTDGQVLATNGAGTLSFADAGSGGGGSGSSYPGSTFQTLPGTDGDFDLSYNVAQTSQEAPFEAGGTDAFGVNLGSVFTLMDPVGSIETASESGLDLGTLS